jgi:hypothetical protein
MIKHANVGIVGLALCLAALSAHAYTPGPGKGAHKATKTAVPPKHRVQGLAHGAATRNHAGAAPMTVPDREALEANHFSASGEGEFTPSSRLTPPH